MTNTSSNPLIPELDRQPPGKSERPAIRHRNPQTLLTSVVVIARARDELAMLTGYKADSVSGFERTDEGWRVTVTAIELKRIPPSTDILATYEVALNDTGDIVSYERTNRYLRNQAGSN
jgi:hypothetical protein